MGIGVCQLPLARSDLGLVRILPDICVELPTWVVMHEDQRASRRVRPTFDHLVPRLKAYVSLELADATHP